MAKKAVLAAGRPLPERRVQGENRCEMGSENTELGKDRSRRHCAMKRTSPRRSQASVPPKMCDVWTFDGIARSPDATSCPRFAEQICCLESSLPIRSSRRLLTPHSCGCHTSHGQPPTRTRAERPKRFLRRIVVMRPIVEPMSVSVPVTWVVRMTAPKWEVHIAFWRPQAQEAKQAAASPSPSAMYTCISRCA